MDEATLIKLITDIGIAAVLCIVVVKFIDLLKVAMTSQANAYDSLRQWFTSELNQRDSAIKQEKDDRMRLETRFDEQCEETERLKARIVELEAQLAEKIAEIERLKESNKKLQDSDEKKEERIHELEREIKQVKDQRDELVRRLDDLLSNQEKGNGGDKKVSKIADRIDERPSVEAKEKKE